MTATTSDYDRLRSAYDAAFHVLCARVSEWQALVRNGAPAEALDRAGRLRAEAYEEYRRRRDALVEFLLAADAATADTETHHRRVRAVAYRLWEESGRSPGNPDEFWYQAEGIVDRQDSVPV